MAKIKILVSGKPPIEVEIDSISQELSEILSDSNKYCSPSNRASVENRSDQIIGYFPAGSIVIVPKRDISSYESSQQGNFSPFVTYTFKFIWDENYSKHDSAEHWNLKIYKSIHYEKGKVMKKEYTLPIKSIDHIKDTNTIKFILVEDSGNEVISEDFYKE